MIDQQGSAMQQLSSHTAAASASARADEVRASQLAVSRPKEVAEVGSGEAAKRRELADRYAEWRSVVLDALAASLKSSRHTQIEITEPCKAR
eukprot:2919112-Amphidinium_carterae.1